MPSLLSRTNTGLKYVTAGYATWNADAIVPNTSTIEGWFDAGPALKEANGGTGSTSLASITPSAAWGVTPASASNATYTLAGGGVFVVTGGAMQPAQSIEAATGTSGGYSFAGDTDTLLYRSAANVMRLRTNGTDALIVNASQEVIVQTAAATTLLEVDNTAVDGDPLLAFSLSGTQIFTMGVDDGDSDKFKIGTTAIGTNTRLTIDSSGFVGIGTTTPDTVCHVSGDTGLGTAILTVSANTGGYAEAIPVAADVEASIAVRPTYRADASTHSAGYYSVVSSGGHGAHSACGLFERDDLSTRLYLQGADSGAGITAPYLHCWDEANSVTDFVILSTGSVGCNIAAPLAQVHIESATSSTTGLRIDSATSQSSLLFGLRYTTTSYQEYYCRSGLNLLRLVGVDLGADVRGPYVEINHNTNGTTPSAGCLTMDDKGGTAYHVHPDDAGLLRIGTTIPIGSADTTNTVVGDQTSYLASKDIHKKWTDPTPALQAVLSTDIYDFQYKADANGVRKRRGETFTGLVTDYAPWAGMEADSEHPGGKSLNPINTVGYLILSIQALQRQITALQGATHE